MMSSSLWFVQYGRAEKEAELKIAAETIEEVITLAVAAIKEIKPTWKNVMADDLIKIERSSNKVYFQSN